MTDAAKKAQLRQLMKQQKQSEAVNVVSRIDSPLAKYTDKGDLICLLCKSVIKTETLWTPHINSVPHKQKLLLLAKKKQQRNAEEAQQKQVEEDETPLAKRRKLTDSPDLQDDHNGGITHATPSMDHAETTTAAQEADLDAETLKLLKQEWDVLEQITHSAPVAAETTEEDANDLEETSENDENEDDDEMVGGSGAEMLLFSEHLGRNRLLLLKQKLESTSPADAQKNTVSDEMDVNEEEDEESEESDVDLASIYDWRAKAI